VTAVPAPVARALITGLKHSFRADDAALRALVPQKLLSVDAPSPSPCARSASTAPSRAGPTASSPCAASATTTPTIPSAPRAWPWHGPRPSALWLWIMRIGGRNRYYYMNWLWLIREIMDWLVAAPGSPAGVATRWICASAT
jgi:hypothetical protein